MIKNAHQHMVPVISLLEEIKRSPINFRLTGSRFFDTCHQNSDWDFFVEDSESRLGDFLGRFFVRADNETERWSPSIYLCDPTIATVWTNKVWSTNPNDNIHIQVIKHELFHIKETAQRIIKDRNLICRGLIQSLSSDVVKKINKYVWMSVQHTLLEIEKMKRVPGRCRRCSDFKDLEENHGYCRQCWSVVGVE